MLELKTLIAGYNFRLSRYMAFELSNDYFVGIANLQIALCFEFNFA